MDRTRAASGAACIGLISLSTMLRNDCLLVDVPQSVYTVSIFVSGLLFIPLALLARLRPRLVAQTASTVVAAGFLVAGALLWLVGLPQLPGALGIAWFLAADLLINAARTWATTTGIITLAQAGDERRLIGCACAGVGGSYLVMLALRPLALAAPLTALVACQGALLALGAHGARATLQEIREQPSAHALEVTNPFSFVPLMSHMYGCIFLFESTFGFVTRMQIGAVEPVHYVLLGAVLLALAGATRLFPGTAGSEEATGAARADDTPRRRVTFTEDTLFIWCALTVLAGFLLLPARAASEVSFCLLTIGSQSFYAFMLSVLACLGARNPSGAIIFAATGSALSSCGSALGSALHELAAPLDAVVPGDALVLLTACIALVIIAYVLVGLRGFSFTRFFQEIAPAREPKLAATTEAANANAADEDADADAGDAPGLLAMLAHDYDLTAREQEIAAMLARGRNGAYIQERLVISRNTVKTHTRHIYAKLGIHSQQELIDLFEQR